MARKPEGGAMKRVGYFATAALLGAGWFVVLLLPPWTREWLLSDRQRVAWHVAMLAVAGVLVAKFFRRYIDSANGAGQHLQRALLLPYTGCLVYLASWNVFTWCQDVAHRSPHQVHDMLVLFPWGFMYALAACFVVIPYGLLCQHAMQRALEWSAEGRD